MSDIRLDILINEVPSDCVVEDSKALVNTPFEYVFNAMDENGKRMCLELLDHMAKNMVICGHWSSPDGFLFKYKGVLITKEQLFENFL